MREARHFILGAALLAGCAGAPSYQRPAADLPASWQGTPAQGVKATGERWWTLFSDTRLDHLIDEALSHNQDLALAAARVDEARALVRVTDSAQMPAVGADFQGDRRRLSERSATPFPSGAPLASTSYRAQLNVAYEVDLWGRLRSASRAARANLLATEAARETVRITLATEVARGYFALVALDAQVAATDSALRLRAESLELQKVRAKAGLIDDLNLRQLEAEIAAAEALLPVLHTNRTAQELALAVLAGRSPRAIVEGVILRSPDQGEPPPTVIPEGLPSDLLLRRPDIAEAEAQLVGANARIAEARAALFPRIVLTGFLGSESAALGDLFSQPATTWSLAFALAQPIFQGGRLVAQIDAVKARERQALAQYQKALQGAFSEVRRALSAQVRAREVFDAESARVTALAEALRLARIRYANGLLSQLEVIDFERNLLQAQLNRVDALRAQRAAVADIVKAFGGGWSGPGAAPYAQGAIAKP